MAVPRDQLEALSKTDVTEPIPQETLLPVLTSPPFIPTQSMINLRDPGLVPGSNLPESRFYRSGILAAAADDPVALAWLGGHVKRIFDLRKASERASHPDPKVKGVENVWLETQGEYPDPEVGEFVEEDGKKAWKKQLMAIMDNYRPVFRAVLEHVRHRPTDPVLFHCTGGRDRTGALAGLLHTLAGTPHDAIVLDYMLSRVGVEPAREQLKHFALENSGADSEETPGFKEMVDLKPAYLEGLEEGLEEKYGGWEGYVTSADGLGMTKEDLETIKKNLRS